MKINWKINNCCFEILRFFDRTLMINIAKNNSICRVPAICAAAQGPSRARRSLTLLAGRSSSLYREQPTPNPKSAPTPPKFIGTETAWVNPDSVSTQSSNPLGRIAQVHPKYCCHRDAPHFSHHTCYHTSQPVPSAQHGCHTSNTFLISRLWFRVFLRPVGSLGCFQGPFESLSVFDFHRERV